MPSKQAHTYYHTYPQAQLEALKAEDVERVWQFAAPKNKAAVGPLENFASLLQVGYWESSENFVAGVPCETNAFGMDTAAGLENC